MNDELSPIQGLVPNHHELKHWKKPTIIDLNLQETKHMIGGPFNDATTTEGIIPDS